MYKKGSYYLNDEAIHTVNQLPPLLFLQIKREVMGSETSVRLPVIDFSKPNLKPGSPEWDSVKSQVRKALEEYGCFEATFDRVPMELRKSLFDVLEALFDLPLQTKLRNLSKKPYHGYVGQYPQVPLYESMGIDDADIIEEVESMTNILWPEGNENFR